MKVILISGHAQNGKDTAASMIEHKLRLNGNRVLVAHYADLVKYVCTTLFGWNGMKDEKGRTLLQYVGTDVVRAKKPTYWVDFVIDMLDMFGDNWDYVLIPDTRFPNEVEAIKERFDAIHVRVKRVGFKSPLTKAQQAHPSETALDDTEPDVWLLNDGGLQELKEKINHFIMEELYGRS